MKDGIDITFYPLRRVTYNYEKKCYKAKTELNQMPFFASE